jgi:hypothetical protein
MDLQPYICLQEDCSLPSVRYSTLGSWTEHLRNFHGHEWRCIFGCSDAFFQRTSFEDHMLSEHSDLFTGEELPTLVDICMKHTLAFGTARCPCCKETIGGSNAFYRHLADHMESLALLSLMPNLLCRVSTDANIGQQKSRIPPRDQTVSPVRSFAPLPQHERGRVVDQYISSTPRRTRSAPCYRPEYGLILDIHHNVCWGDTGDEYSSYRRLRRNSWNSLPETTQRVTTEDSQGARITANANKSISLTNTSLPELSVIREKKDDTTTFDVDEGILRAIFSSQAGFQSLELHAHDAELACYVKFESTNAAFKAAYNLNRRSVTSSGATRLSIDLSGNLLSVRLTTGPPWDAPLLETMKHHPETAPVTSTLVSSQYQKYEQTDQSWWGTKTDAHGSASLDFPSDWD